jgi:hypothetical protein
MVRALDRHAAELVATGMPVVIAGDFNVMPTERDVYKPERWLDDALFAPEVRNAYSRLLVQGWTDALRTLHPDETIYIFWDYFRNAYARNAGLRIDHLLPNPSLAPRLVAAEVDREMRGWEKSSDHAPVWIERGSTFRNDRLIGRVALSVSYEHANRIDDLGAPFVEHLGRWFTHYNALKGKGFKVLGIAGPEEAVALIEAASDRRQQSWR